MPRLIVAAPRFLAIGFAAHSLYSFLLLNHGRSTRHICFRLVFASLFLAVLLATASVVGLFAINMDSKHLSRIEFILLDGVRLGRESFFLLSYWNLTAIVNFLTAGLFHPKFLAPLIAPVECHPPRLILWAIAVLSLAGIHSNHFMDSNLPSHSVHL
jgi:hypothetical protein